MSEASEFVRGCLADFQAQAVDRIREAVMAEVSKANAAGAFRSSARALMVQRVLPATFRAEVESMARILISTESHADAEARAELAAAAAELERRIDGLKKHASEGSVKYADDELGNIARRVVLNVERRLIGTDLYKAEHPIPAISIHARQAAVAIGSPGAKLQAAGGDAAMSEHVIDQEAVHEALKEIRNAIAVSSISDVHKDALRAGVDMVAAPAAMIKPEQSALEAGYVWLAKRAEKAADAGIVQLIAGLGRMLFGG